MFCSIGDPASLMRTASDPEEIRGRERGLAWARTTRDCFGCIVLRPRGGEGEAIPTLTRDEAGSDHPTAWPPRLGWHADSRESNNIWSAHDPGTRLASVLLPRLWLHNILHRTLLADQGLRSVWPAEHYRSRALWPRDQVWLCGAEGCHIFVSIQRLNFFVVDGSRQAEALIRLGLSLSLPETR